MSASFSRIRRRLRLLRNLESANVLLVPFAVLYLWSNSASPMYWGLRFLALGVVVYILIQGSLYWHLKLTVVRDRSDLPPYFGPLFRIFRRSNPVLLVCVILTIAVASILGTPSGSDIAWSMGLTVFALLEHVNYYAYQLTHDTRNDVMYLWRHRRLRKSPLAEDLDSTQSGTGSSSSAFLK